jgi:hypothetical protein
MKCVTVYGCLTPHLCRKERTCIEAPSAERTPELAAPPGALALGTGSLPVSSVQKLLKQWEEYAARYSANEPSGWWLRRCIDELRAEAARATERQPDENAP